MRKSIKNLILFTSLFIVFIIQLPIISKGNNDINYIFNNEIMYDKSGNNDIADIYNNTRNPQSFTETYNATYSFTNDIVGNYTVNTFAEGNISFVSEANIGVGGSVDIVENYLGHNNVLRLTNTIGNTAEVYSEVDSITSGVLEFWVLTIDGTNSFGISSFKDALNQELWHMRIDFNQVYYYSGGWVQITDGTIIDNEWHHFKIDFDTIAHTFDFYINGILKDSALPFRDASDPLKNVRFYASESGCIGYLDGIGYSWKSGYNEGNNLIPLIYTDTNVLQPDKFQFFYSAVDTIYAEGISDLSQWTDIEYASGNRVYSQYLYDSIGYYIDAEHNFDNYINEPLGITKGFFTFENKYNITFSIYFKKFEIYENNFHIEIESSDSTIICELKFINGSGSGLDLYYYDGSSYVLLESSFQLNNKQDFNLYIDYDIDLCYLKYWKDDIYIDTYLFPTIESDKEGIDDISFYAKYIIDQDIDFFRIFIDSIGVYENGESLSHDFSFFRAMEVQDVGIYWYDWKHNLFQINAEGYFNVELISTDWEANSPVTILPFGNYSGFVNVNLYEAFGGTFFHPYLQFNIDTNVSIDNLLIRGCSLSAEGNTYWSEYTDSNIDNDISYFYVNDNNQLVFSLNPNDNDLEYIQASFDIADLSSTDRFISFKSNLNGLDIGNFKIAYSDITDILSIPDYDTTSRYFISQNKTIDKYQILISDDDLDDNSGFTTEGYVSDIKLRFTSNIYITITTQSLIEMMIPLIMIIIPTLAISSVYGKNLVIPLFVLMTIICVITSIIPIWLFFVIIISLLSFIFLRKQEGEI